MAGSSHERMEARRDRRSVAVAHDPLTHGVDILPMYLGGTYEAMPKGASIPRGRAITARIGPPLETAELRRLTAGRPLADASREVARLAVAHVLRGRPGAHRRVVSRECSVVEGDPGSRSSRLLVLGGGPAQLGLLEAAHARGLNVAVAE